MTKHSQFAESNQRNVQINNSDMMVNQLDAASTDTGKLSTKNNLKNPVHFMQSR